MMRERDEALHDGSGREFDADVCRGHEQSDFVCFEEDRRRTPNDSLRVLSDSSDRYVEGPSVDRVASSLESGRNWSPAARDDDDLSKSTNFGVQEQKFENTCESSSSSTLNSNPDRQTSVQSARIEARCSELIGMPSGGSSSLLSSECANLPLPNNNSSVAADSAFFAPSSTAQKAPFKRRSREVKRDLPQNDTAPVCGAQPCRKCRKSTEREYCSYECGVGFFLQRFREERHVEMLERCRCHFEERKQAILQAIWRDVAENRPLGHAERDDIKYLEEVTLEKESLAERARKLEQKKLELQQSLDECASFNENLESYSDDAASCQKQTSRRSGTSNEVVDCVCCGHTLPLHGFATHVFLCYFKQESQVILASVQPTPDDCNALVYCDFYNPKSQTYCKKLKASCSKHADIAQFKQRFSYSKELCGMPIGSGRKCLLFKKACQKHVNWENVRKSELMLEEISLNQMRSALEWDQMAIHDRMVFRRMCKTLGPGKSILDIEQLVEDAQSCLGDTMRRPCDEDAGE